MCHMWAVLRTRSEMTVTMCGGKFDTGLMMRSAGSLHVSHVSRADDEESGPPEFMCHMWMHERPPPFQN